MGCVNQHQAHRVMTLANTLDCKFLSIRMRKLLATEMVQRSTDAGRYSRVPTDTVINFLFNYIELFIQCVGKVDGDELHNNTAREHAFEFPAKELE